MAKKLFNVRLETEIVVVAEDQADAESLAHASLRDVYRNGEMTVAIATPMTYVPGAWDGSSIPYGHEERSDPDRTISRWMAEGAAPAFTEPPQSKVACS